MDLLTHGAVTMTIKEPVTLLQLDKHCTADDFLNLLWHAGYITPAYREFANNKHELPMVIPNKELLIALEAPVTHWLERIKFNFDTQDCSLFAKALEAGDRGRLESYLNYVLSKITDYHDFGDVLPSRT